VLTDFGQALARYFELSTDELAFLGRHADFDRSTMVTVLDNHARRAGLSPRHAEITGLVTDFFAAVRADRAAPYPAEALARAWARAALS
jgi:hypothetical protein